MEFWSWAAVSALPYGTAFGTVGRRCEARLLCSWGYTGASGVLDPHKGLCCGEEPPRCLGGVVCATVHMCKHKHHIALFKA